MDMLCLYLLKIHELFIFYIEYVKTKPIHTKSFLKKKKKNSFFHNLFKKKK